MRLSIIQLNNLMNKPITLSIYIEPNLTFIFGLAFELSNNYYMGIELAADDNDKTHSKIKAKPQVILNMQQDYYYTKEYVVNTIKTLLNILVFAFLYDEKYYISKTNCRTFC